MDPQSITRAVNALDGLKRFLSRSCGFAISDLLREPNIASISRAALARSGPGLPVISFELHDKNSNPHRCLCNPVGFAMLLLIIVCGQSAFIDRTDERLYVKVFGRKPKSAGTIFGRIVALADEGENWSYANGNGLDLTSANLILDSRNKRTRSDMADIYGEIAFAAAHAPDAIFSGNSEDKVREATRLFRLALDRLAGEREEAGAA